jgi:hypothetical protein
MLPVVVAVPVWLMPDGGHAFPPGSAGGSGARGRGGRGQLFDGVWWKSGRRCSPWWRMQRDVQLQRRSPGKGGGLATTVEGGSGYHLEVHNLLLFDDDDDTARLFMVWFWWAVALFTVGDGQGGVLGVSAELPFRRVRACWVRLSIRRKACPVVYASAGNNDTPGCRLPPWRRYCGVSELPVEVLRMKTQFWWFGWTAMACVCPCSPWRRQRPPIMFRWLQVGVQVGAVSTVVLELGCCSLSLRSS